MEQIEKAISGRYHELHYYSPFHILRNIKQERHDAYLHNKLNHWLVQEEDYHIFTTTVNNSTFYFLYQYLNWDSNYFDYPTLKLFTAIYSDKSYSAILIAVNAFKDFIFRTGKVYCFIDIPAEDTLLIQALTTTGFRLTETRLTYYYDQVSNYNNERFPVRAATENDIDTLKKVASESRNDFDRYHADIFFSDQQADHYLATYVEASIKGLCDTVLVPDEKNLPSEAFLAISLLKEEASILDTSLARVVLTAVSPSCKGWHLKLVSETIQYAKENNSNFVLMTTQATNRAVFRTSEKLGFKLGNTTHLLSINN